jgi:hypothetical protein
MLTPDEEAEMERSGDEYDAFVARLMDEEAEFLHERFQELMATGSTTITEATGTWTATLRRPRWHNGALVDEGQRPGRKMSGFHPLPREDLKDADRLEADFTRRIAIGLAFLREE